MRTTKKTAARAARLVSSRGDPLVSAPMGDATLPAAAQRMLDEGAALDTFYDYLRSLGNLYVEYDLLDIERDPDGSIFCMYDDPELRHRSQNPRTFAVRAVDGKLEFEEV